MSAQHGFPDRGLPRVFATGRAITPKKIAVVVCRCQLIEARTILAATKGAGAASAAPKDLRKAADGLTTDRS